MKLLYKIYRLDDNGMEFVHNATDLFSALEFISKVLEDKWINHKHGYTVIQSYSK